MILLIIERALRDSVDKSNEWFNCKCLRVLVLEDFIII